MKNKEIRVVILEPSAWIAEGLKTLLSNTQKVHLVGTLTSVHRWEERLTPLRPDLLLINPMLCNHLPSQACRTLLESFPTVAIVYQLHDPETIKQYDGTISLFDSSEDITARIEESYTHFLHQENEPSEENRNELSDREKEVIGCVAKGMTNKEIALTLNISIHTVISHRKNISQKTGIKSVSGFVVYALLNNLVTQTEIKI